MQDHRRLLGSSDAQLGTFSFGLLSVLLGVGAGLSAYALRALIALFHNLAFLGRLSLHYDSNQHTQASSPWVVLVPGVGALLVASLVQRFAPEAVGHGVPEVMDAIYYKKSVIRPRVALIKALASALSIGTGGSVGREGPIIQIAASLASLVGQLAHVARWQRATLVAAGGGAGIAATFNTPLGGLLFAVEILLHEVSARTLVPVALTTASATFVGRLLFGNSSAFPMSQLPAATDRLVLLPAALLLGVLMALVSVVFIRGLYGAEDRFEAWVPQSPVLRHVLFMLPLGPLMWGLFAWRGHFFIEGIGYATIMDVLSGVPWGISFLLLLAALKLFATVLTLGSGGSGGVFSPSLFMGATLGAAYGIALQDLSPDLGIDPRVFALVGMAALVAGTTSAALTAVAMMFEMTLDYTVILPLTLAAAVAYGLRRVLQPDSIYTMKLTRRGHVMPGALQANAHLVHQVMDLALSSVTTLPANSASAALDERARGAEYIVLTEAGKPVSFLTREWVEAHPTQLAQSTSLGPLGRADFVIVPAETTVFQLLQVMQQARASLALVNRPATQQAASGTAEICGVIDKADLTQALAEGMELFGN